MNLSHENRFLISCVFSENTDDLLNKVKNISIHKLDWEKVLASAFWHGVAALIYFNLSSMGKGLAVPKNVMDKLREVYFQNIARNTYLYAELNNILDAFQEKSVDVILLKGLALAKTVYEDLGARKIGDIDLLVKREDLAQAEHIMAKSGYLYPENKNPEWSREKNHHLNYDHPEKNIPVEIHWHISHKSHPGQIYINNNKIINQFRERAQTIKIADREVKVLCPEDLLIHLSHHFIKHRFLNSNGFRDGFISKGALMQLCDIVRVLKFNENDINWEILHCEAEEYGLDKIVFSTLCVANELAGRNNLFAGKLNPISSEEFNKNIVNLMLKRIFVKEDSSGVSGFLIQSFGDNTTALGIKKIYRTMFPSPEIISEKYSVSVSSKRLYLYYLRRPFDVLLKHRKVMSDMPRIRDDAILKRWLYSNHPISKENS